MQAIHACSAIGCGALSPPASVVQTQHNDSCYDQLLLVKNTSNQSHYFVSVLGIAVLSQL